MKTIFLVMDSLNRHYLSAYNAGSWVKTPNIDRLVRQGATFDSHFSGSLPCMPARREMFTGRYNFLETPWGPIEPWDVCLPVELRRRKGTYSHMITDHYHYFHSGGEAYHTLFDSWELERGQEGDKWRGVVEKPVPESTRGKGFLRRAYWANRALMDAEDDLAYSTPRCFRDAVEFLDRNHDQDNWHLHLEVFDPHEPFDSPQKYRDMYADTWEGELYNWPQYAPLDEEDGPEAVDHIRKRYAGALTMADVWLGKMLDCMDRHAMWEDTVLILSTDHGHLLGEHGYWAKNYMRDYPELAHIPMVVCSPEVREPGSRRSGMTATVDLMPTLMDLHGVEPDSPVHGRSFRDLIAADGKGRDEVIWGYFGKDVNYCDGEYVYVRQPEVGSTVHHHTAMPRGFSDFHAPEKLNSAEWGRFLPCAATPQLRWQEKSVRHRDAPDRHILHRLCDSETLIDDPILEKTMEAKLRRCLEKADAPACQFERLRLTHQFS